MPFLSDAGDPWRRQPSDRDMRKVVDQWIAIDGKNDTEVLVFQDLDLLSARIEALNGDFVSGSQHHFAIKANPSVGLLSRILAGGLGLEAASWGEVQLALAAGAGGHQILFDSPAKTTTEIEAAIQMGITLSIDNLDELERTRALGPGADSTLLLRVNPEVGLGAIGYVSVAGNGSRFGVPISRLQEMSDSELSRIAHVVTGIHYHLGSQGVDLSLHERAFTKVALLARRLSALRRDLTHFVINVGGGAPATLGEESPEFTPRDVASLVEGITRDISITEFRIFTEFGRAIVADGGWCASKIEYVSVEDGRNRLVNHVGADMFLRVAYRPEDWSHRISLLPRSSSNSPRAQSVSDEQSWEVFGPLCFAGDRIGALSSLVEPIAGDRILIHNVGAYTLSLWSRHCNRTRPAIIGYSVPAPGAPYQFDVLTRPESYDDLVEYWN